MDNPLRPIDRNETFDFSCSPGNSCFNACCRDLNQFLTPYDILRLKQNLGLTSGVFLQRYTLIHDGPETGLPVVTLKPAEQTDRPCPFVTDTGCAVYDDRPTSCRSYPLARAVSRSRETGKVTEHFAVLREPHCRGFDRDAPQTVADFLEQQGLAAYFAMNDRLMTIIGLKTRHMPGPLDLRSRHMFHLALYDLDAFRPQALKLGLLDRLELPPEMRKAAATDDAALLAAGHRWIATALFSGAADQPTSGMDTP